MTKEQTEKLLSLYEKGYTIQVNKGYVDGNATISIADQDTLDQNNGFHRDLKLDDIVFDSEVYSNYPLKAVSIHNISVSKPIENWQEYNFEL